MRKYPVNTENKRWSLVHSSTGEIEKKAQKWPRFDGDRVKLEGDLVLLEEVYAPVPLHDNVTHRVSPAPPVVDFENETVTYGWDVVPRDPADRADKEEFAALDEANKELAGHVGSVGERLIRLENMVSRLWRDHYINED